MHFVKIGGNLDDNNNIINYFDGIISGTDKFCCSNPTHNYLKISSSVEFQVLPQIDFKTGCHLAMILPEIEVVPKHIHHN